MAFDTIIRFFFADNGLSAGLAKANAALNQVGRQGPAARSGLRAAEMGMRALAFEAVGLQGPLGRVAGGLLQIGGGSALVLGAVAGIGAIAAAYKLSAKTADDARAATDKLNEKWRALVAEGRPWVKLQNDIAEATAAATAAQEKFNRLSTPIPGGEGTTEGTAGEIALAQNELDAAKRVLNELRRREPTASRELGKQFATDFVAGIRDLEPGQRVAELVANRAAFEARGTDAAGIWNRAFFSALDEMRPDEALAILDANRAEFERRGATAGEAWRKGYIKIVTSHPVVVPSPVPTEVLQPGRARVIGPSGRIEATGAELAPRRLMGAEAVFPLVSPALEEFNRVQAEAAAILREITPRTAEFERAMATLRQSVIWSTMTTDERTEAEHRLREAMGLTAKQAKVTAASLVQAFAGLAAMFISGGSPGGILSGIGGIVGLFNPLAGAITLGLGQIVSASERQHREQVDELRAIRQNTERRGLPDRTSFTLLLNGREISAALVEDVLYLIRREERRDATPRLPPR